MFNQKEYMKKYNKQYRKDNPEKKKHWYEKNPEYMKEYQKQWYIKNKERLSEKYKKYRKENHELIKEWRRIYYEENREKVIERNKQWQKDNSNCISKYLRNKRRTDLKFNLNRKILGAIYKSLRGNKKGRHWEDLVGYTLSDLIKRLKKTMPEGYTWKDYLKGRLHIDHIIPISAHNFTRAEHTDFKRCWALKNLRLLPAKENLIKNDKLFEPFQPALKI